MPLPKKFLEFHPCIYNYILQHFNTCWTDYCSPAFCTVVAHPELLLCRAVVKLATCWDQSICEAGLAGLYIYTLLRPRRVHLSVRPYTGSCNYVLAASALCWHMLRKAV